MFFFLIEIPLIKIKWIWLQLNPLMHETVIGTFYWAVLDYVYTTPEQNNAGKIYLRLHYAVTVL